MPEPLGVRAARYYEGRFASHGATARGVDWKSEESQTLRFQQLLTVVRGAEPYSLIDFGCGYGALYDELLRRGDDVRYIGHDLAGPLLDHARATHARDVRCSFVADPDDLEPADYVIASGVFNVREDATDDEWSSYVIRTIDRLAGLARKGLAFNLLTSYSDPERMRTDLFYADPCHFFDHCKRHYSRDVALLHDYGLYEFTVIVRR